MQEERLRKPWNKEMREIKRNMSTRQDVRLNHQHLQSEIF
ncbi:hypothetical protein HU200_000703 [Digitaria exilis]|uniref:Uncharacterized protein n=1 Tax=Digitaria exilis TaxID=1010633 RepID=A0A835G2J5_9POAL|nr:hypothetical protein HU200_000703 [Digitaria exilis]